MQTLYSMTRRICFSLPMVWCPGLWQWTSYWEKRRLWKPAYALQGSVAFPSEPRWLYPQSLPVQETRTRATVGGGYLLVSAVWVCSAHAASHLRLCLCSVCGRLAYESLNSVKKIALLGMGRDNPIHRRFKKNKRHRNKRLCPASVLVSWDISSLLILTLKWDLFYGSSFSDLCTWPALSTEFPGSPAYRRQISSF